MDEVSTVFAANITLEEARDAIEGRQEFREYDAGDVTIFTYYLGQSKVFFCSFF